MGVGQKVVCIEGYESYGDKLIEGKIYTIQGISGCPCEPAYNVGIIPSGFAQTMCYSCHLNTSVFTELLVDRKRDPWK